MILPLQFKANWEDICAKRQLQIDKDNKRENAKRIKYIYRIGDKVLVTDHTSVLRKLDKIKARPYIITRIYDNSTLRI